MTRINLVPVEELVDKHLVAEKHEITRVLALARNHNPPTYRMGTGHVTFFYNKIGFIVSRYHELCKEMLEGMPPHLVRGYVPDEDAVAVSRDWLYISLTRGMSN